MCMQMSTSPFFSEMVLLSCRTESEVPFLSLSRVIHPTFPSWANISMTTPSSVSPSPVSFALSLSLSLSSVRHEDEKCLIPLWNSV